MLIRTAIRRSNTDDRSHLRAIVVMLCCLLATATHAADATQLRRPIALVVLDNHLFIANHDSGTISIVDPAANKVVTETNIGGKLTDLAATPDGRRLIATDEAGGQILMLRRAGTTVQIASKLTVPTTPVSVKIASDGTFCTVASLWARQVSIVTIDGDKLTLARTIDLDFAPRAQWLSADGRTLLVADAFGGNVAAVHPRTGDIRSRRMLPGHNLRGMALSHDGGEMIFAHQTLTDHVETTRQRVFWGSVVSNVVRGVKMKHMLALGREREAAAEPTPIQHWTLDALAGPGKAAGDPGMTLVTRGGAAIVACSGVDEIAVRESWLRPFEQIAVGRRPEAIALSHDERFVYVANRFSDSISVVNLAERKVATEIPLGPALPVMRELKQHERGEMLFHDARLSLHGWYSCSSCHGGGGAAAGGSTGAGGFTVAGSLLNDNFDDDTFGTPKRVLSLLGVGDTAPYSWTGNKPTLEAQLRHSLASTMQGAEMHAVTEENAIALAAYLRTLKPAPGIDVARNLSKAGASYADAIERGRKAFSAADCARCHKPPHYTSPNSYDVDMPDEAGVRKFNPPSLLGVSQRDRYFHHGKANSLREVMVKWKHGDQTWSETELADLLTFLRSL